ncbi:MAG: rod shape-determining protein MreC [Acidimicrobiales bacterium]
MAKARRSRRTLTTLVVLVLISVSVITLDETGRAHSLISGSRSVASTVFSPVRSGVNGVLDPIGRFFAGAFHYGALQQENQKLQAELGKLRQDLASSKFDATQEEKLQRLLAINTLPSVHQLPKVPAQVTAVGPSNFAATVTIDKGRGQGVSVGDPVMAAGGLIGRVVKASHTTATVQLVTDGQSTVGVTYGNGELATLAGLGPGKDLSLQLVATNTAIGTGQQLVTDALAGAQFPAGIPVAKVATVHAVSGAADKQVTAEPLADLGDLSYVEVLQWSPAP